MTENETPNEKTYKNYMQTFFGQVISMLGSSILSFTIIWWITITYKNPVFISLAYFFAIGAHVLIGPIGGVLADKSDKKKILIITDSLIALGSFAYIGLFAAVDKINSTAFFWLLIGIILIRNTIGAFQGPAVFSIIPLMVPKDKLSQFNGLRFIFFGVINIVGPFLGALLYEIWPLNRIVFIDLITFFIALIPLISLRVPKTHNNREICDDNTESLDDSLSFRDSFKEGITYLTNKKSLLGLILTATAINFFEMPLSVLRPAFINQIHNGNATDLALIVIMGQIGMLTSGIILVLKKEWKNKSQILMIALYVQIIGYLVQSLAPLGTFWIMGIGALIMGTTFPFTNTMIQTIFQMVIPPEKQGRVGSIMASIASAIMPIGMIISGPLALILGYRILFVGSILLGVISITLIYYGAKVYKIDTEIEIDKKDQIDFKEKEREKNTGIIPVSVTAD